MDLIKYKIEIPNIYLIGVAPNRKDMISRYLSILCPFFNYKFNYVDLFNTKGFFYTKDKKITYEDYTFHPNYEAKAFDWLLNNIDYMNHKTLFWIIGRKPSKSI